MMSFHYNWQRIRFAALCSVVSFLAAGSLLAEEAAEGAEEGGLNPLAFQTDLALWTGIVFLGLLLILGKFVFRPIANALDAREKAMADKVAETDKANADAKSLRDTYQQKLDNADAEVSKIYAEAKETANKRREEILAAANAEADEVRAKGKRDVEADREQMLNELAASSATWATSLAGKILKEEIKPEDHSRLIEGALSEFSKS